MKLRYFSLYQGAYESSIPFDDPEVEEEESIPVLTLQAPPKQKLKRQLSSDSDSFSSISSASVSAASCTGGSNSLASSPNKQALPLPQSQKPLGQQHQQQGLQHQPQHQREHKNHQQQQQQKLLLQELQQNKPLLQGKNGQHQQIQQYLLQPTHEQLKHFQPQPIAYHEQLQEKPCLGRNFASLQNYPNEQFSSVPSSQPNSLSTPGGGGIASTALSPMVRTLDLSLTQLRPSKVASIREQYCALSNSPKKSPKRLRSAKGKVSSPVKHKISPLVLEKTSMSPSVCENTPLISPCFSSQESGIKASTPKHNWPSSDMNRTEKDNSGNIHKMAGKGSIRLPNIHPRPSNQLHQLESRNRSLQNEQLQWQQYQGQQQQVNLDQQQHQQQQQQQHQQQKQQQQPSTTQHEQPQKFTQQPASPLTNKSQKLFGRRSGSSEPDIFIFPDVSQTSNDNIRHSPSDEVDGGYSDTPMDMDCSQGFGYSSDNFGNMQGHSHHYRKQGFHHSNFSSFGSSSQLLSDVATIRSRSSNPMVNYQQPSGFDKSHLLQKFGMSDRQTYTGSLNTCRRENNYQIQPSNGVESSFRRANHSQTLQYSSANGVDFNDLGAHRLQTSRVVKHTPSPASRSHKAQKSLSVAGNRVMMADTYAEVLDTSEPDGVLHIIDRGSPDGQIDGRGHSSESQLFADELYGTGSADGWNQQTFGASRSGLHGTRPYDKARGYGVSSSFNIDSTHGTRGRSFDSTGAGETMFTRADTNVLFISPDELSGSSMSCGEDSYSSNGSHDNFEGVPYSKDCIPGGEAPWDEMDGSLGITTGHQFASNTPNADVSGNYSYGNLSAGSLNGSEYGETPKAQAITRNLYAQDKILGVSAGTDKYTSRYITDKDVEWNKTYTQCKDQAHIQADLEQGLLYGCNDPSKNKHKYFEESNQIPSHSRIPQNYHAVHERKQKQDTYFYTQPDEPSLTSSYVCAFESTIDFGDNSRRSEDDEVSGDEVDGFGDEDREDKSTSKASVVRDGGEEKLTAADTNTISVFDTQEKTDSKTAGGQEDNIVHIFDDDVDGATPSVVSSDTKKKDANTVSVFDHHEEIKTLASPTLDLKIQSKQVSSGRHAQHEMAQKNLLFHRPWLVDSQRKSKSDTSLQVSSRFMPAESLSQNISFSTSPGRFLSSGQDPAIIKDTGPRYSKDKVSTSGAKPKFLFSTSCVQNSSTSLEDYENLSLGLHRSRSCVESLKQPESSEEHKDILIRSSSETGALGGRHLSKAPGVNKTPVRGDVRFTGKPPWTCATGAMLMGSFTKSGQDKTLDHLETREAAENSSGTRRKLVFDQSNSSQPEAPSHKLTQNVQNYDKTLDKEERASSSAVTRPKSTPSYLDTEKNVPLSPLLSSGSSMSTFGHPGGQVFSTASQIFDKRLSADHQGSDDKQGRAGKATSKRKASRSLNSSANPRQEDMPQLPSASPARPSVRPREGKPVTSLRSWT